MRPWNCSLLTSPSLYALSIVLYAYLYIYLTRSFSSLALPLLLVPQQADT